MDVISGTGGYECFGMDALLTLKAQELFHFFFTSINAALDTK